MEAPTPFEVIEASFLGLSNRRGPLAIDGGVAGDPVPRRSLPVGEARSVVLHPGTPRRCRQRLLQEAVRLARAEGGEWTVVLLGLLLPTLTLEVAAFCAARRDEAADLQANVIAGVLEDLGSCDPDDPRVGERLAWSASRRAKRRLVVALADAAARVADELPAEPPRPWGHPDLLLVAAVTDGAISADEADLIGETRLSQVPLRDYEARTGVPRQTLWRWRDQAEVRLVEWLRDGPGFSKPPWDKRPFARPSTGCGSPLDRQTGRADGAIPSPETQEGGDEPPSPVSRFGGGPTNSADDWRAPRR